ncbi:HlyC/CorC family transporter [Olivibacter sp. SDN3]|uniref:hemolysin family protein n=1 Tax=Olivibacter sp. SDN3 TaxID=2764720 RepID=UPI0016510C95|nr:hemolysin family protein [Olivibacter sp. SDN3]QNL48404.1 HlyC/CorC family transporter [Olivibacter sp. SDN3]
MEIIIIVILILLNGVFSMSEIALVSSKKFKLEVVSKKGDRGAERALYLAKNPNTFLSTVQIGITLIGILTGIYSGKSLTAILGRFLAEWDVIAAYADSLAVLLVVIAITYLTIVFGELIPKRFGLYFSEKIASSIALPMTIISKISLPLIWILTKTSDVFFKLFGIKDYQEQAVSEEEINAIIRESTKGGEVQPIEQLIVERVFALGDRRAAELMTHRIDLKWFDVNDDLKDVKEKIKQNTHSFYPVCDRSLDNILGVVSVKELFLQYLDGATFDLKKFVHKPLYVSEYTAAYRVLERLRSSKRRYAMVLDEYGDLQGLITISDVVDELIGNHVKAYDDYKIVQRSSDSWLADGQLPFFEFIEYFNLDDVQETAGFTTLGGLILDQLNHIPVVTDRVKWKGFNLEVIDMNGMRIDKILITRTS